MPNYSDPYGLLSSGGSDPYSLGSSTPGLDTSGLYDPGMINNIGGGGGGNYQNYLNQIMQILGGAGQIAGGFQNAQMMNALTDPNQIGQNIIGTMLPMSKEAQDLVARQVYSQLAQRGVTSGGVANEAVADAFAQQELYRQQMATEAYLNSIKSALSIGAGGNMGGGGGGGGAGCSYGSMVGGLGNILGGLNSLGGLFGLGGGSAGGGASGPLALGALGAYGMGNLMTGGGSPLKSLGWGTLMAAGGPISWSGINQIQSGRWNMGGIADQIGNLGDIGRSDLNPANWRL